MAARPRHPRTDLEQLLRAAEARGWRVERRAKSHRMLCPCPQLHARSLHLTPSYPGCRRNSRVAEALRLLGGWGIVIVVGHYRVRLRARIGGLSPEALGDWSFGTLDALLGDPTVVQADVTAALAAGDVEFDLQVDADDVQGAVRVSADALGRASAGAGPMDIEHAEVDLIPVSA